MRLVGLSLGFLGIVCFTGGITISLAQGARASAFDLFGLTFNLLITVFWLKQKRENP